jgi:UDPglucose 6-dehydrogenase
LPSYINEINDHFPNIIYNPEFLRESHASDDFINSNLIVFGGSKNHAKLLANIYKNHTKCLCKDYVYTDLVTASFIKYTINSYLATKVTFFNELNQLFNEAKATESWDSFTSIISRDLRIGKSHMKVPGPDGRFGFGGSCFPKDTNAFSSYADSLRSPLNVLNKI